MDMTVLKRLAVGVAIAVGLGTAALAEPVAFTWDPAHAVPALAAAPAAFTADTILETNYNRTVNTNDLTTLRQTVSADQYQKVTGFTLNGAPVTVPGLNSSFGLYFHLISTFSFPINASAVVIGLPTFSALTISLLADVNNDDGTLSTTAAGIGFANQAGVASDVTLATGSLISANLGGDPAGTRTNRFVTSFTPAAGEAGFFAGPGGSLSLDIAGSSLAQAFSVVPLGGQTFLTLVNGDLGSTGTAQLVPEPASIGLLLGGLALLSIRRRYRAGWTG